MPNALTVDDYQMLYDMQMSADPASRAQASAIANKLTPQEQQAWFDFQQAKPKGPRQDKSVLGVDRNKMTDWAATLDPSLRTPVAMAGSLASDLAPVLTAPESIATMGLSAPMRSVGKLGADVVSDLNPIARFMPKTSANLADKLRSFLGTKPVTNVRLGSKAPALNDVLADAVQSVRETPSAGTSLAPMGDVQAERTTARMLAEREATRKATRPSSPAPPETPSAAPPASKTPGSAPRAPEPPASAMQLTEEEAQAFETLRQEGIPEEDIYAAIAHRRQSAVPTPPPSQPPSPPVNPSTPLPRGIRNVDEQQAFEKLLKAGKSREEALQMIQQMRGMQESHRIPTTANTRVSVAQRNAAGPGGDWGKDWNIWRPNE